jgi:hypothetical protein
MAPTIMEKKHSFVFLVAEMRFTTRSMKVVFPHDLDRIMRIGYKSSCRETNGIAGRCPAIEPLAGVLDWLDGTLRGPPA